VADASECRDLPFLLQDFQAAGRFLPPQLSPEALPCPKEFTTKWKEEKEAN